MKTILFLHREELTYLFIPVAKYVAGRMHIIHVAYSDKEIALLNRAGISADFNYSELLCKAIDNQTRIDQNLLKKIDTLFTENSGNRFNLNSSLQSDRGFSLLTYNEALLLAQAHYTVWKHIFDTQKVDLLVHEPCSLFFNHIGAVMCRAQKGIYLIQSMAYSGTDDISYINITHDDYSCPEVERNLRYYTEHPEKIDIERCQAFIEKFRSSCDVFLQNLQLKTGKWRLHRQSLRRKASIIVNRNRYDRIKQNIDYWLNKQNPAAEKLANLHAYKKYDIHFQEPVEGEKYYYYSLHLEPEAVVLYLGDGIYANQVKLIENIASSLPPDCYLYVKDHPHEFAYRGIGDFLRLVKVPNIRLIRSTIPGKLLIKNAIGVFTINGTAGFEGLMLQKQVYCFGKSYYTLYDKVNYIRNIRDLRETVYVNYGKTYPDDTQFMAFVNAYLDSLHKGMVDFFMDRAKTYNLDLEDNARHIADDLVKFSENFEPDTK